MLRRWRSSPRRGVGGDVVDHVVAVVSEHAKDNAYVFAKRAEVANGRHDFKKGLEEIVAAIKRDPNVSSFYGAQNDAQLELGMYDEAEISLQKMVDLKPNFSSYSRIAYQRELRGDIEGALEALSAAISAGSTHPENNAWAHVELGKLYLQSDVSRAKQEFTRALDLVPRCLVLQWLLPLRRAAQEEEQRYGS